MTVQLDLPAEVVDRLTEEARKKGLSLDAYLVRSILKHQNRLTRAEAGARILEIQSRVKPDPEGLTSRDYLRHEPEKYFSPLMNANKRRLKQPKVLSAFIRVNLRLKVFYRALENA
jgi:hypothetical protein